MNVHDEEFTAILDARSVIVRETGKRGSAFYRCRLCNFKVYESDSRAMTKLVFHLGDHGKIVLAFDTEKPRLQVVK